MWTITVNVGKWRFFFRGKQRHKETLLKICNRNSITNNSQQFETIFFFSESHPNHFEGGWGKSIVSGLVKECQNKLKWK